MSLLSSMGIPPGDPLLASLIEEDEAVREEMERHACPDCKGKGYRRVYRQLSSFERWYVPCRTCLGSSTRTSEGSHTVAGHTEGQGQGG